MGVKTASSNIIEFGSVSLFSGTFDYSTFYFGMPYREQLGDYDELKPVLLGCFEPRTSRDIQGYSPLFP